MASTPTREDKIAEITERLLGDWIAEIKAGNKRAIRDLHNTALTRLTEDDAKAIFIQSAIDEQGVQKRFDALILESMRAVCEEDATNTVNVLAHEMRDMAIEDRIHRYLDRVAA